MVDDEIWRYGTNMNKPRMRCMLVLNPVYLAVLMPSQGVGMTSSAWRLSRQIHSRQVVARFSPSHDCNQPVMILNQHNTVITPGHNKSYHQPGQRVTSPGWLLQQRLSAQVGFRGLLHLQQNHGGDLLRMKPQLLVAGLGSSESAPGYPLIPWTLLMSVVVLWVFFFTQNRCFWIPSKNRISINEE